MSKKSFTVSAKKAAGSLVLLLVFLLPLYLSATWLYGVTGGVDTRKTYSQAEVAELNGSETYAESGSVQPFSEPIVTVTFDDGWESIYSEGFKALEKYNIKSTQYILGDHFGDKAYLSEKQVRSMQAAGHEIAAHSMTHPDLTGLSEEDLEWEVAECDAILTRKFGDTREFATPLGASNDLVLKHLKKYYRSHRNTVGDAETMEDVDINVKETFDPYNINAFTVRSTTTIEELQRYIDYTIQRKGWMIITYHQVEDDNPSNFNVTPEVLDAQLKLIRERKIRTATMGQVLDAIEKGRGGE